MGQKLSKPAWNPVSMTCWRERKITQAMTPRYLRGDQRAVITRVCLIPRSQWPAAIERAESDHRAFHERLDLDERARSGIFRAGRPQRRRPLRTSAGKACRSGRRSRRRCSNRGVIPQEHVLARAGLAPTMLGAQRRVSAMTVLHAILIFGASYGGCDLLLCTCLPLHARAGKAAPRRVGSEVGAH